MRRPLRHHRRQQRRMMMRVMMISLVLVLRMTPMVRLMHAIARRIILGSTTPSCDCSPESRSVSKGQRQRQLSSGGEVRLRTGRIRRARTATVVVLGRRRRLCGTTVWEERRRERRESLRVGGKMRGGARGGWGGLGGVWARVRV